MTTENFNPFIDDERDNSVITSTLEAPTTDKTKHTRGNPKAQPWKTKSTKTEAEKREIQRALLNGESVKGFKTRKAGTIYKRAQMTEKDLLVLTFLAKFDYATTKTLSVVTGVGDAGKRLRGLREWGFLKNPTNTMNITIWTLTHKAAGELKRRNLIEFTPKVFTNDLPLVPFSHTLGISHTAAMLISENNPYAKLTGSGIKLRNLVGERELMRAMEPHFSKLTGGKPQPEHRLETAKILRKKHDMTAATLYSPLADMSAYHRPDLVIKYAEGKAIAVEIELTTKSKNETDAILESFRRNFFGRIVQTLYICKDERVAASIDRSRKRTKTEEQILIEPLVTREGKMHTGATHAL